MATAFLLSIVLSIGINGVLMWVAIMIADPGNRKNKVHVAIGWSFVLLGAQMWPFVGFILGFVVLMLILMNYYVIGFLRSVLVIIVLAALQIGLSHLLEGFQTA